MALEESEDAARLFCRREWERRVAMAHRSALV